MTKPTRTFAVPALLAALSLSATPAAAAELPNIASEAPAQASATVSSYHGGWGWNRHHRYRHRNRTTAGDVLAGVLILGTIAAVANAASKANRERDYRYPVRYPYPDRRDYRPSAPRGVEGAADLCLREIERDARVEDVTRVERNASGWLVTGEMAGGEGFTCSIGADGRIDRIEIGGRAKEPGDYEARSAAEDDTYRSETVEADSEEQPAYPGGPLPGDEAGDETPETDPVS